MKCLCLESRIVLLLGLLLGLFAIIVVPPICTFDGPGHYYRSLQVSRGDFRAHPTSELQLGGSFPRKHSMFVDSVWTWYWQHNDFGNLSRWEELSQACARERGKRTDDLTNIAIESPVNHLVQGLGIRFGELFSKGPLWPLRVGCLFNLLAYLAMVIAAIELMPAFRRGMLLFAVSPLILCQAASISHDAINFALPALFIAFAWHLRAEPKPATTKTLTFLVVLAALVALLKPVAIANLFCALIIPTSVFGSLRRRLTCLAVLFGSAGLLWLFWNYPYLHLDIAAAMYPERQLGETAAHKQWAAHHPLAFLPVFWRFLMADIWEQWPVFFGGVGGWISPSVQHVLSVLSVGFFVTLLGADTAGSKRDPAWSVGLLGQSLLLLFLTCLVCWLALGTPTMGVVPGLGGRYLLLVYLAFFAGLLTLLPASAKRVRTWFFYVALGVNVAGSLVILVSTAAITVG